MLWSLPAIDTGLLSSPGPPKLDHVLTGGTFATVSLLTNLKVNSSQSCPHKTPQKYSTCLQMDLNLPQQTDILIQSITSNILTSQMPHLLRFEPCPLLSSISPWNMLSKIWVTSLVVVAMVKAGFLTLSFVFLNSFLIWRLKWSSYKSCLAVSCTIW